MQRTYQTPKVSPSVRIENKQLGTQVIILRRQLLGNKIRRNMMKNNESYLKQFFEVRAAY